MPLLSILMPTRNRGYLLRDSIQTVLRQNFSDYELIISDNNSKDDTKQIADEVMSQSTKVRYINPGRDLSMCANFEFALDHAVGDYILYLSDDDAFVDGALGYIASVLSNTKASDGSSIEVLVWQRGGYGHPDLATASHRTRLFLAYRLRSGKTYEVQSKLLMDVLCDFDTQHTNYHFIIPKTVNCAISRRVMLTCRERTGKFFIPPYPDYTTVCQLLSTRPSYQVIDMPLYICGTSVAANSGLFYKRMEKVKDYFSLFEPGEVSYEDVPYPMEYLTATYLIMTYVKFSKLYPETFNSPINIDNYLASLATELRGFEQIGDDVKQEKEKLAGYMRQQYGNDHVMDKHADTANSGQVKATAMFYLRQFAATNELTRSLASQVMRLAHVGAPDARQYTNIPSIIDASRVMSRDLKLASKHADLTHPIVISTPDQLLQLA